MKSVTMTDLWSNAGPATKSRPLPKCKGQGTNRPWPPQGLDCVYEDALFEAEVLRIVDQHDFAAKPLFVFWAPHIVHAPAQVPQEAYEALSFITDGESGKNAAERQNYLARVRYIDASIGRLVDLLTEKGVWSNALLVLSSDNGGPLGTANNWPLRGGKKSNFQGGVRVNAFASGGALPKKVRGTRLDELVTIWDWYATFAAVAGVKDVTDHRAAAAGLPPLDSVNQWPLLSGQAARGPRSEVPLGSCSQADRLKDTACETKGLMQTTVSGMIAWIGEGSERRLWKLLVGKHPLGGWTGPKSPNSTAAKMPAINCGMPPKAPGCLFDLTADPEERTDLAGVEAHADKAKQLLSLLQQHNATTHTPDRGEKDAQACPIQAARYGTFFGPWIDVSPAQDAEDALLV